MMMIFMMVCSGDSSRCTVSVVSLTMKMSKVVLLMKMMIFEMMMIFMMMCSGVSLRCTVSVVSQTMKMSKVVLLMKMMII